MNILSINFSHDASICYLKNGEIKLYLKEERFSKIKKDFFPVKCIKSLVTKKLTMLLLTM